MIHFNFEMLRAHQQLPAKPLGKGEGIRIGVKTSGLFWVGLYT